MRTSYDLSWRETSFGAKMTLLFRAYAETQKSQSVREQINTYSNLSSVLYSIAGTARAKFDESLSPWWFPIRCVSWMLLWLPLGLWCYLRMLPVSNLVLEMRGGYDAMSADECDIRQSILRKRGKYAEAEMCIKHALTKPHAEHTHGLLRVGLADIYSRPKMFRAFKLEWELKVATSVARAVSSEYPLQAARIYRGLANVYLGLKQEETAAKFMVEATSLAASEDAHDQILKQR